MAQQLYFSRDTRMFVQFRNTTDNTEAANKLGAGAVWEIPVLDGYSFSQTTNTSEITLAEMESTAGVSRRGTRMFTDSLAPAEWSFSTYIRPFKAKPGTANTGLTEASTANIHAVEEVLWASMLGADNYSAGVFTRHTDSNPAVSGGAVITPDTSKSTIGIAESNRAALHTFVLYFMIDTATSDPLVYRLPEAVVNEVSVDFDVEGIAMFNWSGFAKEIQDVSGNVNVHSDMPARAHNINGSGGSRDGSDLVQGDISIRTDQSRSFNIVNNDSSTVTATRAIDEATTSTKNFIRNRLTTVEVEAATATDKVAGTFPGAYAGIKGFNVSTEVFTVTDDQTHGFSTGDQVYITGMEGQTAFNGTHHFVRVGSNQAGTTNPTTTFRLFSTKAAAEDLTSDANLVSGTADAHTANTGTVASGKYSLVLTGGAFTIGNNITYLVPEELGAINKPLEHVTGSRSSNGSATCYLTLEDGGTNSGDIKGFGSSRQFFQDLVGTGAMGQVVNKFKITMHIGGSAATANATDPALKIEFPTAHVTVPTHSIEDVLSLETEFTALPTDFGTANEITAITYFPVDDYA